MAVRRENMVEMEMCWRDRSKRDLDCLWFFLLSHPGFGVATKRCSVALLPDHLI